MYIKSLGIKLAFATILAVLLTRCLPAAATTVIPKSIQDCIHDADAIFVGQVIKVAPRWGTPTHQWIYTDITFQIEEVLQPNARIQPAGTVTLTYWGGTLDGKTIMASDMVHPRMGERWVMLLRPNLALQTLTPVVGVQQGMLRIDHDQATGKDLVREAHGDPLFTAHDGQIVRAFERKRGDNAKPDVELKAFASWVRANIGRIKATPVKPRTKADSNDPRVLPTFSKTPVDVSVSQARQIAPLTMSPLVPKNSAEAGPALPSKPILLQANAAAETGLGLDDLLPSSLNLSHAPNPGPGQSTDSSKVHLDDWSSYSYGNVPIVVNNFPASFAPWSPEDQYALSRWNYYANIYQVYTNPTGTFAGDDGVFDLDGWPDDATINNIYGAHWDTAGGELAVTFDYLDNNTGLIHDADIAFNPAFSWTLDDVWVFSGGSAWPFRSTMQHEMGHMFGLNHDFNDLSIMNYYQHDYRALAVPYMDDAEAIRSIYWGQLQDVTDLGVYLWQSIGYQDWGDASYPSYAFAGDSIFVNNFHMENVGTETIANPTLEWYLTTSLNYTDPYYYLGTVSYNTPLPRYTQYNDASVGTWLTVPTSVAGGVYYLNAYIRNDGGDLNFPFNNNEGWSHQQITIYPLVTSVGISPDPITGGGSTTGTVYLGSAAGSGGFWVDVSSDNTAAVPSPGWVFVSSGASSASFSISSNTVTAPTQVTLTADDGNGHSASAVLYLTVPTALQVPNVTGAIGATVNLTATLTRTSDSLGLAGEYLYYYVDGSYVGYAVTDSTGHASMPYAIPASLAVGSHTLEVDFFGDYGNYDATSSTATLTVAKAKTALKVAGATGSPGASVTLTATLTRTTDHVGLASETVNFSVDGTLVGSGTTNASGVATFSYAIPAGAALGSHHLTAQFAGDANYLACSGSGTLSVKATTAITVPNVSGNRGAAVTLKATLKNTSSNKPISGATLTFYVGSTQVGTAATNASGVASKSYTIPAGSATGSKTIKVKYAGSADYLSSTGSGTLTIH